MFYHTALNHITLLSKHEVKCMYVMGNGMTRGSFQMVHKGCCDLVLEHIVAFYIILMLLAYPFTSERLHGTIRDVNEQTEQSTSVVPINVACYLLFICKQIQNECATSETSPKCVGSKVMRMGFHRHDNYYTHCSFSGPWRLDTCC